MGSTENFGNNASSNHGGILPPSLLESASLGAALDDNSVLINFQKALNNANGTDPIASELERLEKAQNATENNQQSQLQQDSTNSTLDASILPTQQLSYNQAQKFTKNLLLTTNNNQKSQDNAPKDSLTGNATNSLLIGTSGQQLLATTVGSQNSTNSSQNISAQTNSFATSANSQSSTSNFAIRTEGTISINGNGDFDGVPNNLNDDARIYAAKGFIMNGNLELPVQRDSAGNPIKDASGKLVLVDKAVAVAAGYTTSIANTNSNKYAGLVPPPVVAQQTVA
ncbi:DNA/RNA endonuclease G, NUC1 [Nostoc flagelliforme CCNUN1]|uniref:DNA/RNA endonuclease G, NUC1 n=1 Tax=Nostoc flagelliforme CCNUN1 TaxID=2038116 RepID=A0A2K8SJF8_9NOSO|nr:hypothetical protein [Nostoc flagelliforme]AUB35548.1 DNA/RNA endonuclease G, NUC1 [Nostoc flagelliforme CCNUN1]